jgi:hypothetical protein
MEAWELVKRLLAGALGEGCSFSAGIIAGQYHRELAESGQDAGLSREELVEVAEEFAEDLQAAGLIRPAGVRGGGIAILGAMERTDFGGELLGALQGRNVVAFFEGLDTEIEAGDIRRKLHQLNS